VRLEPRQKSLETRIVATVVLREHSAFGGQSLQYLVGFLKMSSGSALESFK